jgi:hypothetical protein
MTSFTKLFNTKLEELVRDLATLYPDDRELKKIKMGLPMIIQANPKMTVKHFTKHVLPHKEQLLNRDFDSIVKLAKDKVKNVDQESVPQIQNLDIPGIFAKINDRYENMSENSRDAIWKYATILIKIAEKC